MQEQTEIRIIAGTLRGRKLPTLVHLDLRPTPQLVREALFSILGNAVPDRIFYDIFAGTGVVGIEAISRGASRAIMIEKEAKQVSDITKAIKRFELEAKAQVIRTDGYRWAERWIAPPEPVNLFLSPPFPDLSGERGIEFIKLSTELYERAANHSVLALQTEDGFPYEELPGPAKEWDIRRYGRNSLAIIVKDEKSKAPEADQSGESASL